VLKHTLFTPGPTNVPPAVLEALGRPIVHHRAPDFDPVFRKSQEGLQYVFRTKNPIAPLTCSGTGGMEAAVSSLLAPGDEAIAVASGKFGERWGELCTAFGAVPHVLDIEWGRAVTANEIAEALEKHPKSKAVFATHCETSTGALADIRAIAEVVGRTGAVLAVDAISSLGAEPFETDAWGVDVVVAGSQKALMLPPGMAFVSASEKARAVIDGTKSRNYYFNLKSAFAKLSANTTPFTSAISMIVALNAAIDIIRTVGIEAVWERHRRTTSAIRAGCEALGLSPFGQSPSNVMVALEVPDGLDADAIVRTMRDAYGMTIAGGQGRLKGKILRVAALGYVEEFEVLALVGALEMTLRRIGRACGTGAGVAAAQSSLNVSMS
jgi:aspartate aminotransferase-like enzyme